MKAFKILIEATPIFRNRSGVGQYTYNLLEHLFALDHRNHYYLYGFLFAGKKFTPPYQSLPANVQYRLIRYLPSKVHNVLARRFMPPPADLLSGTRNDVVLFTNFVRTPLMQSRHSIVIVYDLSFLLHPQHSNAKNNQLLVKQVPKAVRQADQIITISQNSKTELIEHYHLPADKIHIIYPAYNPKHFYPRPAAEIERVKKHYGIGGRYILFTGTIEPRKNIVGLLNAYDALPEQLKSTYSLVLAGGGGWRDEAIRRRLEQLKQLSIIQTGYFPDADLPALYSGADVFAYPSFYEGFGMPPLEAMACGVPVITSNNSSLPEVVGEAAVTIEAANTAELTRQLQRVLTEPQLADQLRQAGLRQAKQFSWSASAEQLLALINEVAAS